MDTNTIKEILDLHKLWVEGNTAGKRADLCHADLHNANLRYANLHNADLYGANLYNADLHGANLYGVNLRGANLYNVYLRDANLHNANLRYANLHKANLCDANLRDADLYGAKRGNYLLRHFFGLGFPNGFFSWGYITTENALIVEVGCKTFSLYEGRKYWSDPNHHAGPDARDEILAALDYFEMIAKSRKWIKGE